MSAKTFSREEVRKHASDGDLWIIIDGAVYVRIYDYFNLLYHSANYKI